MTKKRIYVDGNLLNQVKKLYESRLEKNNIKIKLNDTDTANTAFAHSLGKSVELDINKKQRKIKIK